MSPRKSQRRRPPRKGSEERAGVRLQKLIAASGLASRREAEAWVRAGRVKVDGHVVTEPTFLADPARHHVTVDGKPVRGAVRSRVYLVHKPRGLPVAQAVPGSATLTGARPTTPPGRLIALGGLGVGSEGLLLFTTDGEMSLSLTRSQLPEAYRVRVRGRPTVRTMDKLRRGVVRPARGMLTCERAVLTGKGRNVWLILRVTRGRDREIRSVLRTLGHPVVRLCRTAIGPVTVAQSRPGEWRELRTEEVERLVEMAARPRSKSGTDL